MRHTVQLRTIWRTAAEQCEIIWDQFSDCRVRLWVQNRLILDEAMSSIDEAIERALELRTEWPSLVR